MCYNGRHMDIPDIRPYHTRDVYRPKFEGETTAPPDSIDVLAQRHGVHLSCRRSMGRANPVGGRHVVRHGSTGREAQLPLAARWKTGPKSDGKPTSQERDAQRSFDFEWRGTGRSGSR